MCEEIDDPAGLIPRYCIDQLTPDEERKLLRSAAEDQYIFNQLMEAEAMRDALGSAEQRNRLKTVVEAAVAEHWRRLFEDALERCLRLAEVEDARASNVVPNREDQEFANRDSPVDMDRFTAVLYRILPSGAGLSMFEFEQFVSLSQSPPIGGRSGHFQPIEESGSDARCTHKARPPHSGPQPRRSGTPRSRFSQIWKGLGYGEQRELVDRFFVKA